ncbi:MAG: MFS transporter [Actinomycetota bacterium]|nr:MFS transporter [Actinomycetota bacterium]
MSSAADDPHSKGQRLPLVALFVAFLVSVIGTSMSALAIPWLVLTTTGSAGRTGLVLFVQIAPYVTMLAISGPFVDRIGAHRAVWAGNLFAGVVVCVIPVLYATGNLSLPALAVLAGSAGVARGVADTGVTVLVPGVARLGKVAVERISGLNSAANQIGLLLGAPLGGVLLTFIAPAYVVLIDGITFGVAALLIGVFVPRSVQQPAERSGSEGGKQARATDDQGGYFARLRIGFAFLLSDRLMLGLASMIAVTNLAESALSDVLMPTWVLDRGHLASALGVLAAGFGIGGLVGNLIGAWVGQRMRKWATYSIGFLLGGAPLFWVMAGFRSVAVVGVVALLSGLFGGAINPILGGLWYRRVPHELLARVIGAIRASAWVGVPIGPLVGGLVADRWGVTAALWAFGGLIFLATLAPFVFPVFRQMDAPAPVSVDAPADAPAPPGDSGPAGWEPAGGDRPPAARSDAQ